MGSTKKGDPFLSLTLADRSGEIEARVWERANALSALFSEADILEIEGSAGSYRGEVQLTLSDLKAVKEVRDPSLFIEATKQDVTKMMLSLREVLRKIENPQIRSLTDRFLSDSSFVQLFKRAPAAKNFHHSTWEDSSNTPCRCAGWLWSWQSIIRSSTATSCLQALSSTTSEKSRSSAQRLPSITRTKGG